MLSSMELAQLEKSAKLIGALTSDEAKFLTQSSLKKSIDDLLSPKEISRLSNILSKLASEETLEQLKPELSNDVVIKLQKHYQGSYSYSDEYFMEKEVETGLLAETVHDKYNISFSLHDEDSTAFFKVLEKGENINISFNKSHHIYPIIKELKERDIIAYQLFLDLFHSWGLYEMDFHSEKESERLKEYREMWGRKLRDILRSRDATN